MLDIRVTEEEGWYDDGAVSDSELLSIGAEGLEELLNEELG